jgi:sortase A
VTVAAAASRASRRRRIRLWGVVGVLGELMVTLGVLLLLFAAWELWWTDVEANRAAGKETSSLVQGFEATGPSAIPDAKAPGGLIEGKAFALLHVPRFGDGWSRPILEGTTHDILQSGLGHYAETVGPGAVGNFAVAGHRTTWGRPFHDVENLVDGDTIVVETRAAYDVYAVTGHEIVAPTDVDVVAPVPDQPGVAPTEAMLTLTTCHPKYSARQRYVVHAKLVKTFTRAEGLPASVLAVPGGA